jgi:hypothetical protein
METRNIKDRITYYFGAGASANSIPMVEGIQRRLTDFTSFLNESNNELQRNFGFSEDGHIGLKLNEASKTWINQIQESPSIDTLAKRLYDHKKNEDYREYKAFLTVLFNYFHFVKIVENQATLSSKIEGRYENLLRSINQSFSDMFLYSRIPSNFNFISWNYDFDFFLTLVKESKQNLILAEAESAKDAFLKVGLFNLNGSSRFGEYSLNPPNSKISLFKCLAEIFNRIVENKDKNALKFAWEDLELNSQFLLQRAKEPKYVVVIGYSFPSFNRELDNVFFQNLENTEIVYVQGRDYSDSQRIERYLRQIFRYKKLPFEILPVESPFFFVPPSFFHPEEKYHAIGPISG